MPGNNLDLTIGIDTKKLKSDTQLIEAEMRKISAEMKKLSDQAIKGNDDAKKSVDSLSRSYDELARKRAINNRLINEEYAAVARHAVSTGAAAKGMGELTRAHAEFAEGAKANTKEVFALSRELGKMELSGLGVAKAFREFPRVAIPVAVATGVAAAVKKTADEAKDFILTLDRLSKSSGFAARDIAGMQHFFEGAGVDAKYATEFVTKLGEGLDKVQAKKFDMGQLVGIGGVMRGAAGTAGTGVQVFRGPGLGVDDGHGPPLGDGHGPGARPTQSITPGIGSYQAPEPGTIGAFSQFQNGILIQRGRAGFDPERMRLGLAGLVDPSGFNLDTEQGRSRWLQQAVAALRRLAPRAPSMARELLRAQGAEDPERLLQGLLGGTEESLAEAQRLTLGDPRLRRDRIEGAEGLERAELRTEDQVKSAEAAGAALKSATLGVQAFGNAVEGLGKIIDEERPKWQNDLGSFTTDVTSALDSVARAAANFKAGIPIGSQEGQTIPIAPPEGHAAGGLIGGFGTGDTVPAMLTPGEFVNRRASVSYYGPGLFAALNSQAIPRSLFGRIGYASGGLVGDAGSFAEGGSVGGSTAVHLHLDGESYAMKATEGVASALVVAARRQQMRSAGVKPSWYGGRPGS